MRERLAALAMDGATFEAALADRDGYGPTGGDEVEFLIAPNPGVPAGPLREIASGGELSRVMLALMGVAAEAGPETLRLRRGRRRDRRPDRPRGRRAAARRSRAAARSICITHLPQIASLADRHFTIVKDISGATARTTVSRLERADLVGRAGPHARRRRGRHGCAAARAGAPQGRVTAGCTTIELRAAAPLHSMKPRRV